MPGVGGGEMDDGKRRELSDSGICARKARSRCNRSSRKHLCLMTSFKVCKVKPTWQPPSI